MSAAAMVPPTGRSGFAPAQVSRRALLITGASAAVAASLASVPLATVAGAVGSSIPDVSAPVLLRRLGEVTADAEAAAGARFASGPWQSHFQLAAAPVPWSALFVAWLLREAPGDSLPSPAGLHRRFADGAAVGMEPRPGALIFYSPGGLATVDHVGFVASVRGPAIGTIEADVPGGLSPGSTFVRRFGQPWATPVAYAYPDYAA